MQRHPNPFSRITLMRPSGQRDFYRQYCEPPRESRIDRSPFSRPVDLWFAGLSIAARNEFKRNAFKSIDRIFQRWSGIRWSGLEQGSIFDSDRGRVEMVMLVAIAVDGVEVAADPKRMMFIANRLAAAGVPRIVEMLKDGDQEPIWNLSDALERLLTEE